MITTSRHPTTSMSEPSRDIMALHVLAPGQEGGLERVVSMLAEGQRSRGVHVVAVVTPNEAREHPFIAGLASLGIPVTPVVVGARSYIREYQSLSRIVAYLRPEVVHTHGYRADVIAGAVARAHGVPTVSTVHGFTGSGRHALIYEAMQCIALRRADAVIAVSGPLVHRLERAGVPRARIHCIPNGFAPPEYILERDAARQKLGIRADATVAVWVGRLSREKGADVTLSALSECDPSWQLSMIGDGPERDRLREQAAKLGVGNRITWHGFVPNAGSLLTAFDAFVLSSRTEGTPIALFEAMHAGVPLVAARVGGVPDVVAPAHALLVPPENPRMIARALEEISRRKLAAIQRSTLARARLLHSFGPATWLAAVESVYDGLLGGGKHPHRKVRWRSQVHAKAVVGRV